MAVDNRTTLDKLHTAATRAVRVQSFDKASVVKESFGGIDLDEAVFGPISVNEAGIRQKPSETDPNQPRHDDPVGLGMAAFARPLGRRKYYIGKFRMDALRSKDGRDHFTSCGFGKHAVDELYDGDGKPLPMWAIYLTEDDEVSSDEAEQPVAIFTRRGIRFLSPVHFDGGVEGLPAGGASGTAQQLWDGTGKYFAQLQNDGNDADGRPRFNFVAYEASTPFSIGNPVRSLFSSNDILARLSALEADNAALKAAVTALQARL